MTKLTSPAIAFVGRHNSGKTTLVEKLIGTLSAQGLDIGSIKHHGHCGFDVDVPGKDSFRHQAAGASETVIAAPDKVAQIYRPKQEIECSDLIKNMHLHDLVIVEGYRKSGLPCIEIMRQENDADQKTAQLFLSAAKGGQSLDCDFSQMARADENNIARLDRKGNDQCEFALASNKMPDSKTVAVVSDIPEAIQAAGLYEIPCFNPDDISAIAEFLKRDYVRKHLSVVIAAGGESKRMGQSKATVPFLGRPLIVRSVERLSEVADELIITTNEPENLEFLHTQYPELDIKLVRDCLDTRGALPGMLTAFSAAKNPYVAVIACDLVSASPKLIAAQVDAMSRSGADVVIPKNKHGYEPFHALYNREFCKKAVQNALDMGETRVQSFFKDLNLLEFSQHRVLRIEPLGGCFVNVNTPAELESIQNTIMSDHERRKAMRHNRKSSNEK